MMEGLCQSPSPHRSQFAGQQGVELLASTSPQTAPLAQKPPAQALQLSAFFLARGAQSDTLSAANFIHHQLQMLGNVDSIEHKC